jgi:hypothetical protein
MSVVKDLLTHPANSFKGSSNQRAVIHVRKRRQLEMPPMLVWDRPNRSGILPLERENIQRIFGDGSSRRVEYSATEHSPTF